MTRMDPDTESTVVIEDHGVVKGLRHSTKHVRRARPRAGAQEHSDGAARARTVPEAIPGASTKPPTEAARTNRATLATASFDCRVLLNCR